jgi:hypothetical protein
MRALLAVEGLHIVSAVDRKVLDAADVFFDSTAIEDDDRSFDALMEAVHARRNALPAPEQLTVIGPRDQAVLKTMAAPKEWELRIYLCEETEETWVHEVATAELARRAQTETS